MSQRPPEAEDIVGADVEEIKKAADRAASEEDIELNAPEPYRRSE